MEVEVDDDTGEIMEGRHVRPFTEWLMEHRSGALAVEAGEALNAVVDAVNVFHKGGSMTLTIKIKPAHRGEGMVLVVDEITTKVPEATPEESFYFVTGDANLSRANPAQPELPLREVPPPKAAQAKEIAK